MKLSKKLIKNLLSIQGFSIILREIKRRILSKERTFIMKMNLESEHIEEGLSPSLKIRELSDKDISLLFPSVSLQDYQELLEYFRRIELIDNNVKTAYVALNEKDQPIYLQWVVKSEFNDLLKNLFYGGYLPLDKNEAMIAGVYTPLSMRGKKIMYFSFLKIMESLKKEGIQELIAHIREDNISSKKAFLKLGFHIYKIRYDSWFLFRRKMRFIDTEHFIK